jgi:hypothetical protein
VHSGQQNARADLEVSAQRSAVSGYRPGPMSDRPAHSGSPAWPGQTVVPPVRRRTGRRAHRRAKPSAQPYAEAPSYAKARPAPQTGSRAKPGAVGNAGGEPRCLASRSLSCATGAAAVGWCVGVDR